MENIAAYTKGCLALGISQFDCFNTVDLFEAKNLNLVYILLRLFLLS